MSELEILVVDDGLPDGTAEVVRELCLHQPALRLIRRVGRRGLASAIKEGLLDPSERKARRVRDVISLLEEYGGMA